MMKPSLSLVAAALVALASPLHGQSIAPGLHDPGAIDRDVANFTGQPIGAPGGAARPIDRRLRLGLCHSPLAMSWRGDAHAAVLVECPDAGGWHVFVALAAAARQSVAGPVIERGQSVNVALTGDGFSVSQSGEALENGALGAWIKVRTTAKGDPLQARIVGPGAVEVPVE